VRRRRAHGTVELAEGRDVVEHPEGTAVRGGDEIAPMNVEIAHGRAREVELERSPVCAVVHRVPDAGLGADEEQAAPNGIFANRPRVRAGGETRVDARPAAAVVGRLPEIGPKIVELIAVGRDVRGASVEV